MVDWAIFFSPFCSSAGKGTKSSAHLHKHKYLLFLGRLIAVIKAGIEWIRCLFHHWKALESSHTLPQNASLIEDNVQKLHTLFKLIIPFFFLFNTPGRQSHHSFEIAKLITLSETENPPRIQGHAVQTASNKKEGHICAPSDVHWSDR